MATLMVRDVDDEPYGRLTERARANGRTVSAEVRALIAAEDNRARQQRSVTEFLDHLRAHPLRLPDGHDAVSFVRTLHDKE